MKGKGTNRIRITERLVWIGIGVALFWWLIETSIHAFVISDVNFFQALFRPRSHELWMLSCSAIFLILFSSYAQFVISKRGRADEETRLALEAYISLFEKIFLELLENILTNQSGIFELPPTGLKILVHRAGDI